MRAPFACLALALACASCAHVPHSPLYVEQGATVDHKPKHSIVVEGADKPEVIAFQVPLEATQQLAALAGPVSRIRAFQFSCTTAAAPIVPSTAPKSYSAIWVWVNSATPVYFGDSARRQHGHAAVHGVDVRAGQQSFEARALSCLSSSGTVVVNVMTAVP
jgi:hypothetical protein